MKAHPPEPPAPPRLYLDTSAYLCVLLGEERAAAIARQTDGAEPLSSVLLVLESRRNLAAVFIYPRGSTSAIALVFSPALIGVVALPGMPHRRGCWR